MFQLKKNIFNWNYWLVFKNQILGQIIFFFSNSRYIIWRTHHVCHKPIQNILYMVTTGIIFGDAIFVSAQEVFLYSKTRNSILVLT